MPKTPHRRKLKAGRVFLLLVIVAAALFGVYKAFVRAPELTDTAPLPAESSSSQQSETSGNTSQSSQEVKPADVRKPNFFNILVSGLDDGNGGSDTNILVGFDADGGSVHCVSIPRDTLVNVSRKVKKINAAYNMGGSKQLSQEISDMLGVPVDFSVQVNLKGFAALVDAIGGVDFTVPINMNYDDPVQGLSIHFTKGSHHLNGQEALEVVRFRHNNDGTGYGTEDIGRIGTQQAFLTAVAKKALSPANLSKVSSYAKIFHKYVDTDLSLGNLAWLGTQAIQMGTDNIHFSTLPGSGSGYYKGISYYTLDPSAVLEMVNITVNPYTAPRTAADLDIMVP